MKNIFTINLNYIKRINALENKDLVEIIGLTSSTVSNLLNDKSTPNAETLLKISEKFNYSIDALLKTDLSKQTRNVYNVSDELNRVEEEVKRPLGFTPSTGKVYKTSTPIEDAVNMQIEKHLEIHTRKLIQRVNELEKKINNK